MGHRNLPSSRVNLIDTIHFPQEQAQAQGWSKANKLEGRNTTQGLVGVCLSADERNAAIVELNSETDFVAKNKQFHSLLNQVIAVILDKAASEHSNENKKSSR